MPSLISNIRNFQKQSDEETAGFFVAFSRAEQRVIFTYCEARGTRAEAIRKTMNA